jgi:hypothetical protein
LLAESSIHSGGNGCAIRSKAAREAAVLPDLLSIQDAAGRARGLGRSSTVDNWRYIRDRRARRFVFSIHISQPSCVAGRQGEALILWLRARNPVTAWIVPMLPFSSMGDLHAGLGCRDQMLVHGDVHPVPRGGRVGGEEDPVAAGELGSGGQRFDTFGDGDRAIRRLSCSTWC